MFLAKSISDTFFPITIIKLILGIGVIECPFGRPRVSLSLLYTIFSFLLAAISSIIFIQRFFEYYDTRVNYNSALFIKVLIYGNVLFYLISIIKEMTNRKELKQCFQEINIINKQFESIGIREKYHRLLKRHLYIIGILITLIAFHIIINWVRLPKKLPLDTKIIYSIVIYFLFSVPSIIELQFLCIISYLKEKFIQLNNLLQSLTGCDLVCTQYVKVLYYKIGLEKAANFKLGQRTNDNVEILKTVKAIHLDLVKICEHINEIFGLQILISLGICIALVTVASLDVFCAAFMTPKEGEHQNNIIAVIYLFGYYVIKVLAVNHVCHMTSKEASYTESIVYELHEPTTNAEFRSELEEFISQLMQNPLVLTAHGCFNLNHQFIQSIVGMITTYLIILIQLKTD